MIDVHAGIGKKLVNRGYQQKDQRPAVDAKAVAVGHRNRRYLDVPFDAVREFP